MKRTMLFLAVLAFVAAVVPVMADEAVSTPTPIRDNVNHIAAGGAVKGFEGTRTEDSKKESFFGSTNMILTTLQFGAAGLDLKTTFDCLGLKRTDITTGITSECVEGNPRMKGAIAGGWGPALRAKALANVPVAVGGHFLRRSDNKFLRIAGWVLPGMMIGWQMHLAINNYKLAQEFH